MNNNYDEDNPLLRLRPTINPYLKGAWLIVSRIIWDINPVSWVSRNRLKQWKNKFTGKKAIILCNGPSLLKVNLSLLEGFFTFGLNKINLIFEKEDFRPSCIVAINPFVIEQNSEFYNQTEIPLFLDSIATRRKLVKNKNNRIFLHSSYKGFAQDCSVSISQGYTVTYVALQLAFHMGFEQVALVGADHNFATKGPANKVVISGERDESHFDPRYFSGGEKWQLPDLFESEVSYMTAKRIYEAYGRKIFNCTEGGKLEIYERMPIDKFVL